MNKRIILVITLVITIFAFSACSNKTTLTGDMDENGKSINITVDNASKGDYFVAGTLIVEEGEQLLFDTGLNKGDMYIEFFKTESIEDPDEISINKLGNAIYTKAISVPEYTPINIDPGYYIIKPTVTEKANGSIKITVQQIEEDNE